MSIQPSPRINQTNMQGARSHRAQMPEASRASRREHGRAPAATARPLQLLAHSLAAPGLRQPGARRCADLRANQLTFGDRINPSGRTRLQDFAGDLIIITWEEANPPGESPESESYEQPAVVLGNDQ